MTDELDIKRIQTMWNDRHMSYTEIADHYQVTRSTIAGQINRAKASGVFFEKRIMKPVPRKPKPVYKITTPPAAAASKPISIFKHQDFQCKEVMGDDNGVALLCSAKRMAGRSYCDKHDAGKNNKVTPSSRGYYRWR